MKQNLFIIICFFSLCFSTHAQKTDYNWVFGYGWWSHLPPDSIEDLTLLKFDSEPLLLDKIAGSIQLNDCNVSASDENGDLLFYTNCQLLLNSANLELKGSNQFNAHRHHNNNIRDGLNIDQGMLVIQGPGNSESYYLIYSKLDFELGLPNIAWLGMQYSRIDMLGDYGLGEMREKQISILPDSVLMCSGGLTATKHANGRDWWIIQPLLRTNKYARILLTPEGLSFKGIQEVGTVTSPGLPGATFSPDGSWYVRNNQIGQGADPDFLDIYHFDRCTGLLSDHLRFSYGPTTGFAGGVSISSNNRYLYVPHSRYAYQFDLWSADIPASQDTIAIYDGYRDTLGNQVRFFRTQLAPDGRIYLNSSPGSEEHHIINQPNGSGANCEFLQRGIIFPTTNFWSMVNFPNYRLGPIDGSSCDTLGIDNVPLAGWRYDRDCPIAEGSPMCWKAESELLTMRFTDNSWYEPATFSWIIDDIKVSLDTNLIFTFPEAGTYEVCHTAENQYGADTLCRLVTISDSFLAVGPEIQPDQVDMIRLYPNPATDYIHIDSHEGIVVTTVSILNMSGQSVGEYSHQLDQQRISVNHLSPGIYIISMTYEQRGVIRQLHRKVVVE